MIRRDPGIGRAVTRKIVRGFDGARFQAERLAAKGTYRADAGLGEVSIADLGRLSGVGATTIYGWESGRRDPHAHLLRLVADVLRIPMDRLIVVEPDSRTLVYLRWLAGMTQPQVAKELGSSSQTFSRIERGESPLTDERAIALAAIYNVAVDDVREAWRRARDRPPGAPA